jgi:DNA-binding helix-hairpin-helix protein with protein kinase domain
MSTGSLAGGTLATLTVERSTLGRREELNRGANGVVYRLRGYRLRDVSGELVYKEYKTGQTGRPAASVQGLTTIIQLVNQLQPTPRAAVDEMTVWPLRVVVNAKGEATGVLMRLIPDLFFEKILLPSKKRERIAREVQHLIVDPARSRRSEVAVPADGDLATRVRLCERLAYLIAALHGGKLVYGDVSARNILYTLRPTPSVLLVDCDAARKEGSGAVNRQADSPDWDPPETQRARQRGSSPNQTQDTDRYKLALFILRCLTPGTGSSLNRDPTVADRVLDRHGRDLMRWALEGQPGQRPRAVDWWTYLRARLGEGPMPPSRGPVWQQGVDPILPRGTQQPGWRLVGGRWVPR